MHLVQYVIIRRDLFSKWGPGATVAQACHAVLKCSSEFSDDPKLKEYLSRENVDRMTKIILEVKDELDLLTIGKELSDGEIDHVIWNELPENIPTCIALKPNVKDHTYSYLKRLKLFK